MAFSNVVYESEGLKIIEDEPSEVDEFGRIKLENSNESNAKYSEIVAKSNDNNISEESKIQNVSKKQEQQSNHQPRYKARCKLLLQNGFCKFGDSCHFDHDFVPTISNEPKNDQECAVCMEFVLAKGERFGLLTNCEHPFCLSCIREWRAAAQVRHSIEEQEQQNAASTETVRSCPLCRKFSPYVIPSLYFVKSSKAKEKLQQVYLNNTASKRCKYWSGKPGSCQFGSSCHYKHLNPDGTIGIDTTRSYVTEDGEIAVVHAKDKTKISDFIILSKPKSSTNSTSNKTKNHNENVVSDEELPKWARGLNDDQIQEQNEILNQIDDDDNQEGIVFENVNFSTPARGASVNTAQVAQATKGFAELELGPKKTSSTTASSSSSSSSSVSKQGDEWTIDEQKRFEAALLAIPGPVSDKARWKKIAEAVGTRKARECVARYRECATKTNKK